MFAKHFEVHPAVEADSDGIAEAHIVTIRALGPKARDPKIIDDWPLQGEWLQRVGVENRAQKSAGKIACVSLQKHFYVQSAQSNFQTHDKKISDLRPKNRLKRAYAVYCFFSSRIGEKRKFWIRA